MTTLRSFSLAVFSLVFIPDFGMVKFFSLASTFVGKAWIEVAAMLGFPFCSAHALSQHPLQSALSQEVKSKPCSQCTSANQTCTNSVTEVEGSVSVLSQLLLGFCRADHARIYLRLRVVAGGVLVLPCLLDWEPPLGVPCRPHCTTLCVTGS